VSLDRIVVAPRGTDAPATAALVERARRRGFTRFALPEGWSFEIQGSREVWAYSGDEFRSISGGALPRSVRVESIRDPAGLERVLARAPVAGVPVAVRWLGERVLPLETLLARSQGRFEVWVVTDRIGEVGAALGGLERGADTVVVELRTSDQIDELEGSLDRLGALPIPLTPASVVRVVPAGLGDRVLVDTTSLLAADEGLLVGSAAGFLYLVLSEAVGSRYTRPRPFRVNAGAAHSYTLLTNGTTRYLSELEPGDALTVVRTDGTCRSARVGRLKIERRPLVLVQGEVDKVTRTVFVQEAETVRLQSPTGAVAVTSIAAGDSLLGLSLPAARHLGTAVEETILER
jgi:3-dehydroquinate synthase II